MLPDWRYAPSKAFSIKSRSMLPVVEYRTHPKGTHKGLSPINPDKVALECVLSDGHSAWYGVEEAIINAELRMIVYGGFSNPLNELARSWAKVDARNVPNRKN